VAGLEGHAAFRESRRNRFVRVLHGDCPEAGQRE